MSEKPFMEDGKMAVINTNVSALIGLNNLRLTNLGLKTSLQRLSSGLRINQASDDPSGLAIAKGMEGQIGGIRAATQNAEDAINLIHTADGALSETHDILLRMRDLAVRAANEAVLTTNDVIRLNDEFCSLKEELERKSHAVTFNTKVLFSGLFASGLDTQIGPDNGFQYRITIQISATDLMALSLNTVTYTYGGAVALYSFVRSGVVLYDSTVGTVASQNECAQSAITKINSAIERISNTRSRLGVQERRLNHIIDDLAAEDINISAAKSRIIDADMAQEIAEFTRLQILQQSGTAILAQANAQPQSVLQLLQ